MSKATRIEAEVPAITFLLNDEFFAFSKFVSAGGPASLGSLESLVGRTRLSDIGTVEEGAFMKGSSLLVGAAGDRPLRPNVKVDKDACP